MKWVAIFFVVAAAANANIISPLGVPVDSAAVLAGPSGTVVRSGVQTAYGLPLAYAQNIPLLQRSIATPLLVAPEGSGLEGQWIPDVNERFYDDGSYKPYIYGY